MTSATTMIPYRGELEYCMDIAYEAGTIAMEFCNNRSAETASSLLGVEQKIDDSPVTLVDKKLDAFIKEALEKRFPDCLVVGEESSMNIASTQKLEKGKVFYVDPIDGTKEFISNNGEWCVMIGLNVDGFPVMGVVYVASRDHMYFAIKGHGAYLMEGNLVDKSNNWQSVSKRLQANQFTDPKQMTCLRSRSHDEREITDVMLELGVEKAFPSGSFGLKCGLLAQGTADLYINASKKTHYWDTVAPGIIASEAGCVLLDIDGNELQYTGVATHTVHEVVMFATSKSMKEQVMSAVQKVYAHRR